MPRPLEGQPQYLSPLSVPKRNAGGEIVPGVFIASPRLTEFPNGPSNTEHSIQTFLKGFPSVAIATLNLFVGV